MLKANTRRCVSTGAELQAHVAEGGARLLVEEREADHRVDRHRRHRRAHHRPAGYGSDPDKHHAHDAQTTQLGNERLHAPAFTLRPTTHRPASYTNQNPRPLTVVPPAGFHLNPKQSQSRSKNLIQHLTTSQIRVRILQE